MKTIKILLTMMVFNIMIENPAWAQETNQDAIPCYFDELMDQRKKQAPDYKRRILQNDQMIHDYLSTSPGKDGKNKAFEGMEKTLGQGVSIIIPVVVYVVHQNGSENISDVQVQSQIDVLNTYYDSYGIQFCLATKQGPTDLVNLTSPSGVVSSTPGIFHYYNPTLTNHDMDQQAALTASGSALSSDNYLRIWVVKGISSSNLPSGQKILGYATFPNDGNPSVDGIIMSYDAFGDIASCSCTTLEPYSNTGKTLVHEVGHYLGLYHTFHGGCQGMAAATCDTIGDKVCDTPPVAAPNTGCPTTSWNTCNESPDLPDDIHNYMDYTSEACRTEFTDGQNSRMIANINLFRSNLVSTPNLIYTGVSCTGGVFADFQIEQVGTCVGSTATFSAVTISGATYTWDFGDGSAATGPTVSHTYTSPFSPASVVLTVDDGVNSASATQTIFIEDCQPILSEQGMWYFGIDGGMDFSSGSPVYNDQAHDNNNTFVEACAVQSDGLGSLLFYTNGEEVWNNNHIQINSSAQLMSDSSAHHGVVIVPSPVNPSHYYLFTKDAGVSPSQPGTKGFRYSIVAISSGSALTTTQWNIPIAPPAALGYDLGLNGALLGAEGITVAKACDEGYWIITTGTKGPDYFLTLFKLTSSGLSFQAEYPIPINSAQTSVKVSPNGKKLAVASGTGGSQMTTGLIVYDFDNATGNISNPSTLNSLKTYGFMFSPDSRLIYSTHWGVSQLIQYDLEAASPAASGITVWGLSVADMQLGPDNKLYLAKSGTPAVSVIHKPNERVSLSNPNACMYTPNGPVMESNLFWCLPNMINATETSVFAHVISAEPLNCLTYSFSAEVCAGSLLHWNFGDPASGLDNTPIHPNPTHEFTAPGTYIVTLQTGNATFTDTIVVGEITATINGAPTICLDETNVGNYATNLSAGQTAQWTVNGGGIGGLDYQEDVTVYWSSLPGTVTLTVTDTNGCSSTEVFTVTESCMTCSCDAAPAMIYSQGSQGCEYTFSETNYNDPDCAAQTQYVWNFGDGSTITIGNNVTHTFPQAGTYEVCLTVLVYDEDGFNPCEQQICEQVEVSCVSNCDCELKPYFGTKVSEGDCIYSFNGFHGGPECLENVSYYWDFGDGSTASGINPSHSYAQTGTYDVCLTVVVLNTQGEVECSKTHCKTIEVECVGGCDCKLAPAFKVTKSEEGCIYMFEGFHGGPECLENVEYHWDFGDGTYSIGQTAGHAYAQEGEYNVCLTVEVKDDDGNVLCKETYCEEVSIKCKDECHCELEPSFDVTPLNACELLLTAKTGSDCVNIKDILWYVNGNLEWSGSTYQLEMEPDASYEVCIVVTAYTAEETCVKTICDKFIPGEGCAELFKQSGPSERQVMEYNEMALHVFPNPAQDKVSLQFNQKVDSDVRVALKSVDGKVLSTEVITADRVDGLFTVSIPASVPNGFVIVEIQTRDKVFVEKVMIMKK